MKKKTYVTLSWMFMNFILFNAFWYFRNFSQLIYIYYIASQSKLKKFINTYMLPQIKSTQTLGNS